MNKAGLKWGDFYTNEEGELVKYYPLHDGQKEILNSTARFTSAICGTGGGKTSLIPLWLMKRIQQKPQGEFICVSPNFKMLRRTILKEIQSAFEGTPFQGTYSETRWEYHVPCGAKIYLYSADEPNAIQGVHADGGAVIDEAGLQPAKVWDIIRQRCNLSGSPVLILSTPYDFRWLYKEVYLPWKSGNPEFKVVSFSSLANPSYNRDEFEREKAKLPEWRFRMLYEGQFTRPAGVIYPDMPSCVVDKMPTLNNETTQIAGLDFGFNDPTAALIGQVIDGVLYLYFEKYERQKTLKEFSQDLPKEPLYYCDNSRPDSIKEMRRSGFRARPCKKYAGSVSDGIELVNGLIRTGRLKIVRGKVTALLDEADYYTYADGDREGEYIDQPIDSHNHALDALRYLCQGAKRMRLISD